MALSHTMAQPIGTNTKYSYGPNVLLNTDWNKYTQWLSLNLCEWLILTGLIFLDSHFHACVGDTACPGRNRSWNTEKIIKFNDFFLAQFILQSRLMPYSATSAQFSHTLLLKVLLYLSKVPRKHDMTAPGSTTFLCNLSPHLSVDRDPTKQLEWKRTSKPLHSCIESSALQKNFEVLCLCQLTPHV